MWANAIGGAVDPGNWYRREWVPALIAIGLGEWGEREERPAVFVPRFHFHELRHYAATMLDEQGMSGKLRTEIVGHADENITNSVYTHVSKARIAAAAREYDPLGRSVVDQAV